MPPLPRSRRRWSLLSLIAVLAVVGGLVLWSRADRPPPAVHSRDAVVDVVDGPAQDQHVQLRTTLFLPQHTPAPAIIVAHGFGGTKDSVADQARELASRGFVVLTYTARGFGNSTGQIGLNSPDYEVSDARQLVDWLARQPEVLMDGPNDPRVGVTGGSYGGALALLLAGTDRRVDTIAPVITYNDLSQALLPNAAAAGTPAAGTPAAGAFGPDGVFKRTWAGLLFSAGLGGGSEPSGEAPERGTAGNSSDSSRGGTGSGTGGGFGGSGGSGGGSSSSTSASAGGSSASGGPASGAAAGSSAAEPGGSGPPGAGQPTGGSIAAGMCGRFLPEVCRAYIEVATTGRASQQTVDLLRRDSPVSVTDRITVPTLLVQGEQDTLFGLDQADANARQITRAGGKVKMVWYTGGHDGGNPGPELRGEIADWFDFHLAHRGADPGTGFEYAVQGAFRNSGSPSVRTVTAAGYPGLIGGGTSRTPLRLSGGQQTVLAPPGGSPASISGLPGSGSALSRASSVAGGLAADPPGEAARFTTVPLDAQLLVAGSPTVRLRVAAPPGQSLPDGAVLFAKLYDVGPDGARVLPGSAVAPMRLTNLPADGSPVDVTVTLPGIVRPVEAGHRLQLVVSSTDQAYANLVQPAVLTVALAGDGGLAVPTVPGGRSVGSTVPTGPLLGIAAVLALCLLAALAAAVRRRRGADHDPELADVPLVISGLTKSYPGGVTAVEDLSFRVERGQVLGLLGPNGAGKTTTLRMLMGLVRPTTGEIRVFGHAVHAGSPVLSRVGSFVEGAGFLPHLSGAANLRLYWAATGRPAEEAHVAEALEIAGLGDAVRRRVGTYSQGMRQRLAIAQAMLGLPDLLVLDEPTNGLDPPQIHQMRDVLRRYAATGRTVLVSSHLLAEVEQTCTHVVVMHRGRLVAEGEVAQIVAGGGEATFLVDQPARAAEVLRGLDGVEAVVADHVVHADLGGLPRSAAVATLVEAGVAVEQAGPRRRLEDAFLQLVGEETP
nr:alpha/beta fold hydrolase [Gandjariella thermophila]